MTTSTEMPMAEKVRRLIQEQTEGLNLPERIMLSKDDYNTFMEEVKPLFNEVYGSLVGDRKTFEEGYENILFYGVPVCLEVE